MIAALALRLGVANWILEVVLACAGVAGLTGCATWYHHHVFQQGVAYESARRDGIEAENSRLAKQEQDNLNGHIAVVQAELNRTRDHLAALQKELSDEKAMSTDRQRELLAGRERMRILTRARPTDPNQQVAGGPVGSVDQGPGVEYDIDPGVSAWLERVRSDHNEAVKRLSACIISYDAVKAAADAMP